MKPELLYRCLPHYHNLKIPDGVFEISNISQYIDSFRIQSPMESTGFAGGEMLDIVHRLPFPECWFEYTATGFLNGKPDGERLKIQSGVLVTEDKDNHTIKMTMFSTMVAGYGMPLIMGEHTLYLDEHFYPLDKTVYGTQLKLTSGKETVMKCNEKFGPSKGILNFITNLKTKIDFSKINLGEADELYHRENANIRLTMGFALRFLNCKNIKCIDTVDTKELNKRKRKNKPYYEKWKTLQVTGVGISSGQKDNQGDFNPLHICRGHFKTFTTEKPLFGQHTGAYWWADQVRGHKEVGVVEKNYECLVT